MKAYTTSELRQKSGSLIDTVMMDGLVQINRHGRTVAYVLSASLVEELGILKGDAAPAAAAADASGSMTVRELAEGADVPVHTIGGIVTELVADPQWGRERVIAKASENMGATLIQADAATHIARRAIAVKLRRTEGAA